MTAPSIAAVVDIEQIYVRGSACGPGVDDRAEVNPLAGVLDPERNVD
jgi:hypothetical protein